MIRLLLKTSEGQTEHAYEQEAITIGRKSDNVLNIPSAKVSRYHARISRANGGYALTDLGSNNGSKLNGSRIQGSQPLKAGDEIGIGDASIQVIDLPVHEPSEPAVEPETAPKSDTRIRARQREIPKSSWSPVPLVVILLALGGIGVGAHFLSREISKSRPASAAREPGKDATTKALEQCKALEQEAESAPYFSDDLARRICDRAVETAALFSSKSGARTQCENPFESLYAKFAERETSRRARLYEEIRDAVEGSLSTSRYDRALVQLAQFQKDHPELTTEEEVKSLVADVSARAENDYQALLRAAGELETARHYGVAARLYVEALPRFKETRFHDLLAKKPEDLLAVERAEVAVAERARQELTVKHQAPALAAEAATLPQLSPLSAIALEALRGGVLNGLKLLDGVVTGGDETGIKITSASAETLHPWHEIPAEGLLTLYEKMAPKGETLLSVSEFALAHGLTQRGEILLNQFVGGDRKERKEAADALLARARGEARPEGGYTWNGKLKSFESPAQLANRTALEQIDALAKKLASATTARALEESFDKIFKFYNDVNLAEQTRDSVRTRTVDALQKSKEKRIEKLKSRAMRGTAFNQLRSLKEELNLRRKAALALIFDDKIYLPENHPDWPKGDDANGQTKVDELVNAVKQIWEQPVTAAMDSSLQKEVEQITAINESYLRKLGVEPEGNDLAEFEDILNNLNAGARLTIQSYAINGSESKIFAWNRRVDAYNAALQDPDVTQEIKDHVTVVNDYREMMGLRRCFIDARICRATTKHSNECNKAQRIWHVGPDGDPQSRAKAEGFTTGVSENVALGYANPYDIWWRGWYRASDHHRNGVMEQWNCVGYGYVGNVGTQNFSNIGSPKGF